MGFWEYYKQLGCSHWKIRTSQSPATFTSCSSPPLQETHRLKHFLPKLPVRPVCSHSLSFWDPKWSPSSQPRHQVTFLTAYSAFKSNLIGGCRFPFWSYSDPRLLALRSYLSSNGRTADPNRVDHHSHHWKMELTVQSSHFLCDLTWLEWTLPHFLPSWSLEPTLVDVCTRACVCLQTRTYSAQRMDVNYTHVLPCPAKSAPGYPKRYSAAIFLATIKMSRNHRLYEQ